MSEFENAFWRSLNRPENRDVKQRLESYEFKISQEILGARIQCGLSAREMAEQVVMDEAAYRGYENGIVQESRAKYEKVLGRVRNVYRVLIDFKGNILLRKEMS